MIKECVWIEVEVIVSVKVLNVSERGFNVCAMSR
jgi:hypothetical protein